MNGARVSFGVGLLFVSLGLVTSACQVASGKEAPPRPAESQRASTAASVAPPSAARRATQPPGSPATGCPEEMVRMQDACIDRYEAHLVVEAPDGSFQRHPYYERPVTSKRYAARSERGVMPQAYVSRVEASAACQNAGKRLCSVAEWYDACRGSARTPYPYGAKFERGRCNVGKAHLLSRFFGSNAEAWEYAGHFNNPLLSKQPGFLAKTGEHAGCVNDYGVFDMVGNLQEWVADPADRTLSRKLPLKEGIRRSLGNGGGKGVFLGGFYSTTNEHGRGCAFVTAAHEVQYHDYSIGFRCCKDAE